MPENPISEKYLAWEEHLKRVRGSQDVEKIFNYIAELAVKESFRKDVSRFRKKYLIPAEGFKDEDYEVFEGVRTMPEIWISQEDDFWNSYEVDEKRLMKKYELPFTALAIFRYFLESNILGIPIFSKGLCTVDDFESLEETLADFDVNNDHPVLIRVSPYASKRDILNFVEISFQQDIKPLQDKYKKAGVGLGKIRSKNQAIQKRNAFIYDHRDKSIKEIRGLLAKKKIFLDDGHISKIRTSERKKRKEV